MTTTDHEMKSQVGGVPPSALQVRVSNITKTFKGRGQSNRVLDNVSLEIEKGEFLVLLGPSGCGKTTLLRCLVGLERPDGGSIDLKGDRVVDAERAFYAPPNRRDVAMVFQNYALWPHMTVRKNVAYPLKARRMKDALNEGRVDTVLEVVQCSHLADRYPPELSGGQQQRVSLARALASRPSLLLLDEPLSNLDVLLRIELRAQLRLLHKQIKFTGVFVTHDQEEALALGTRVAVMNQGRIEQIGKPQDVYRAPATEYVADFLGARNRLEMIADGKGNADIDGQNFPGLLKDGIQGRYTLRVRDSHVKIRPAYEAGAAARTAWLSGVKLVEVLPGGEASEYLLESGATQLFASAAHGTTNAHPGDIVEVGLDLAHVFCYDETDTLVSVWAPKHTGQQL